MWVRIRLSSSVHGRVLNNWLYVFRGFAEENEKKEKQPTFPLVHTCWLFTVPTWANFHAKIRSAGVCAVIRQTPASTFLGKILCLFVVDRQNPKRNRICSEKNDTHNGNGCKNILLQFFSSSLRSFASAVLVCAFRVMGENSIFHTNSFFLASIWCTILANFKAFKGRKSVVIYSSHESTTLKCFTWWKEDVKLANSQELLLHRLLLFSDN